MRKSPHHLKQLEKELLALGEETMLLEELDGFIAGLLVCPELINPSEWLPVVWGSESEAQVFDNVAHLNRGLGLVMAHYDDIAEKLLEKPESYMPHFGIDDFNGDVVWELWIEGFEKAVKLRPIAWRPLLGADMEAAKALSGLLALADVVRCDEPLSKRECDALAATALEHIGPFVLTLNEWRVENDAKSRRLSARTPAQYSSFQKVGRNGPCPCGSGKKYKRCCGLN